MNGDAGNDRLKGGTGRDAISGGSGNDRIFARDKTRGTITCWSFRHPVIALIGSTSCPATARSVSRA